ncbi:MAG: hypothetical protein ACPL6D_09400 [Thermodesulfobacteriota bacterium]
MNEVNGKKEDRITPWMTVLEIVDRYPNTVSILKKYDDQAGVCICCHALFETLKEVAKKYRLDLDQLLLDLEDAIDL